MCERMNFITYYLLMKIKCAIYGTLDVKGYKNCKHFRVISNGFNQKTSLK